MTEEERKSKGADSTTMPDIDVVRNIIRAWKDEEYRQSLSRDLREQLPEHPAGLIDLIDAELWVGIGVQRLPGTYATKCSEGWRCLSETKC